MIFSHPDSAAIISPGFAHVVLTADAALHQVPLK